MPMNTARSCESCDRLLIVKAPLKQQQKPFGTQYVKCRVGLALVCSLGNGK